MNLQQEINNLKAAHSIMGNQILKMEAKLAEQKKEDMDENSFKKKVLAKRKRRIIK